MKLSQLTYEPGHYLAFVLDEDSRRELLAKCKPSFEEVVCHHVTLVFPLTEESLKAVQAYVPDDVHAMAYGTLVGNDIECVGVSFCDKMMRVDKKMYHVTVSKKPGVSSAKSNELFMMPLKDVKNSWLPTQIKLNGTIEMVKTK